MESSAPATSIDVPGNSPELQAITYTTSRLSCRRIFPSDAEDIFRIRSNENVADFSSFPPDKDVSETIADMKRRASRPLNFSFAITLRTPDPAPAPKLIGFIGGTKMPEIGYGMNHSYWDQGYVTEALEGYVKMYWEHFPQGYPGIEADAERNLLRGTVTKVNPASARVLTKAGFRYMGEMEVDDLKEEGKIVLDVYEIRRPGREGEGSG